MAPYCIRGGVIALALLTLTACGTKENVEDELLLRNVTLPNGTVLKCEVKMKQDEMARGMMFRPPMAPGRGMLFIHASPGYYTYYMFHVQVPLDIIWMDQAQKIVEISPNTPPCTANRGTECPTYGGHEKAAAVLELNGGDAQRYGLNVGQKLSF